MNLENFKNSEIPPFTIAHPQKIGVEGGLEGLLRKGRSNPKKFFLPKNAYFGRKSRIGRFFERKKLPKIYHTTD